MEKEIHRHVWYGMGSIDEERAMEKMSYPVQVRCRICGEVIRCDESDHPSAIKFEKHLMLESCVYALVEQVRELRCRVERMESNGERVKRG